MGDEYEQQIAPLLAKQCVRCHGDKKRESGLRVDSIRSLRRGGDHGPAIVPGDSTASLLVQVIRGEHDTVGIMPQGGKPLAKSELDAITRWIDAGARGPNEQPASKAASSHWSFRPIAVPSLPIIRNQSWPENLVDRFILARLEANGVPPSPQADQATLIRRLSLDLVGLPPTVEDVDAFLTDASPDAYSRLVDRLLASPHFGERWGRHWLDSARFADSNGYTIDGPRSIWKYRDWVITALNRDLPFDEFVTDQLAGDLQPNVTLEQRIATGFHRNTMFNEEGGTDKEQFRVERVVDRVNTTGTVFLGLTIGCAQCHSHKYDPISQREYYELFAFFDNADESTLDLPTPQQQKERVELRSQIEAVSERLKARKNGLGESQPDWENRLSRQLTSWTMLEPIGLLSSGGATFSKSADRSVRVDGINAEKETTTVVAISQLKDITAFRLEVLVDGALPKTGPGRAPNGNFVLSEFRVQAAPLNDPTKAQPVAIASASADHSQDKYPIAASIDDNSGTGWAINTRQGPFNTNRTAIYDLKSPIGATSGTVLTFTLEQHAVKHYNIGRFRISASAAAGPFEAVSVDLAALIAIPENQRTGEQREKLADAYAATDELRKQLIALERRQAAVATTMIVSELATPRQTHVHMRGDFLRPGAAVTPDVPGVLPPLRCASRPTRFDLARWLVAPENPLTARVTVNRVWQQLFGVGIVETENDFGTQGTPPSHPELLDRLAAELVGRRWSMKELLRLIVSSATYRQASLARPDLSATDPQNRLLARQNRLRLEAEIVRDAGLSASGLLVPTIGGPSVFPYQPDGVMQLAQVKREWKPSTGADRFRRTLYTNFWRSTPHPFLKSFDAPNAQVACTRRTRSNTPLQSLMMLNDLSMIECARAMGRQIMRLDSAQDNDRLLAMFRIALGRSPTSAELQRLMDYLNHEREAFQADPSASANFIGHSDTQRDGSQYASWTSLARVLFNLDEFITRE